MATENGGPAFPNAEMGKAHFDDIGAYPGLSARDYFAAAALTGLLASSAGIGEREINDDDHVPYAMRAYEFADAMIQERGSK